MSVSFIKESPTDKEHLNMLVENMLVNGNMVNIMEKELTYMLTEISTLENGKKVNITNQTISVSAMEQAFTHM
jgi:hypothetical protein